ncbi:DUF1573 domain-containing protein [Hyunsoonleella sp. 2307UL5-6]|uniref:DUF1573 domain-containing protein n=1 Tax=Hyunsoonleella sp. 2307UL5-6 TaxID=3384768 RepID=UPI0039BCBC6B
MKKVYLILVVTLSVLTTSCKNDVKENTMSEPVLETAYPAIKFDKTEHDFGPMKQGEERHTTFYFTNTGVAPLIISDIKAKCGCTVPNDWQTGPIAPGSSSEFTVSFNSRSKEGRIKQPITLTTNTKNGSEQVAITATVSL